MRTGQILVMVGALSFAGRSAADEQKPSAEEHVRGDVVALRGDALEVKTRTGESVTVELPKDVAVAKAEKADLGAIQSGAFVGMTTVPERDGTLRAVEVHVFPESMRGTGEGSRPWDLRPGSNMTNGTVASTGAAAQPASTMTNATVANVAGSGAARSVELKYGAEGKKVMVPPATPVVRLEKADRSALKPGVHVFAIAKRQPDGKLLAQRITVGEGRVRPPM